VDLVLHQLLDFGRVLAFQPVDFSLQLILRSHDLVPAVTLTRLEDLEHVRLVKGAEAAASVATDEHLWDKTDCLLRTLVKVGHNLSNESLLVLAVATGPNLPKNGVKVLKVAELPVQSQKPLE
jgi:hypothetical protein